MAPLVKLREIMLFNKSMLHKMPLKDLTLMIYLKTSIMLETSMLNFGHLADMCMVSLKSFLYLGPL